MYFLVPLQFSLPVSHVSVTVGEPDVGFSTVPHWSLIVGSVVGAVANDRQFTFALVDTGPPSSAGFVVWFNVIV